MKNISKFYIKKVFKTLLSLLFLVNIILAQEDINIYFDRTISYYNFFPELLDPFDIQFNNFSLRTEHTFKNYYTINPRSLLKKIKKDTRLGSDGKTFISYETYENNDISIPSVVTINYYTEKIHH